MSISSTKQGSNKKRKQKIPRCMKDNESLELIASPLGPISTPAVATVDANILLERLESEIIKKFQFSISSPPYKKKTCMKIKAESPSSSLSSAKKQKISEEVKCTEKTSDSTSKNDGTETPPATSTTTADKTPMPLSKESIQYNILKKRMIIGINQCTRTLESFRKSKVKKDDNTSSSTKRTTAVIGVPSLILLARDIRPPTILAHIPLLCKELDVPILLLPGKASLDIGQVVGVKTASIMLFLEQQQQHDTKETAITKDVDDEKDDDGVKDSSVLSKKQQGTIENICHQKLDSYITFAKTKLPSSFIE